MLYQLLKLTDLDNRIATYGLMCPEGHCFEFTYKTLRPVLLDAGFSSNLCGSILRLLHKRFPCSYEKSLSLPHPSDYHLATLIDYLKDRGFKVFLPLPLSDSDIIEYLNSRGYLVSPPLSSEIEQEQNPSLPLSVSTRATVS